MDFWDWIVYGGCDTYDSMGTYGRSVGFVLFSFMTLGIYALVKWIAFGADSLKHKSIGKCPHGASRCGFFD